MKELQTRVAAKQRWQRFERTARVLGVLEGYVVYRFKNAGVHAVHWKVFEKHFTLVQDIPAAGAGKEST